MPDVVVGRADHGVDVGLVLTDHRVGVGIGVWVGRRIGVNERGDQREPDALLHLIDPGDAVDRRDDRGLALRDGSAEERGVLARCRDRQSECPQRRARRRRWNRPSAELQLGCPVGFAPAAAPVFHRPGKSAPGVAGVVHRVALRIRIDEPRPALARARGKDLCVKALRRDVGPQRRHRIGQALPHQRDDLRMPGGEVRRQNRRLDDAEALHHALWVGKFEDQRRRIRPGRSFQRCLRKDRPQRAQIDDERLALPRPEPRCRILHPRRVLAHQNPRTLRGLCLRPCRAARHERGGGTRQPHRSDSRGARPHRSTLPRHHRRFLLA